MSEDLISKEKAYKVLTEYYHHKTDMQHKALREALDMVPPVELQPTCNKLATNLQPIATDCISRRSAIAYAISGRVRTLPTSEDGENWIRTEDVRQSLLTMPSVDIDLSDYSDRLWRKAYEQGKADAEPERKRGKWQEDTSGYGFWICSNCGFVSEASGANILYIFCPHCGAEMEKGEADDAD